MTMKIIYRIYYNINDKCNGSVHLSWIILSFFLNSKTNDVCMFVCPRDIMVLLSLKIHKNNFRVSGPLTKKFVTKKNFFFFEKKFFFIRESHIGKVEKIFLFANQKLF